MECLIRRSKRVDIYEASHTWFVSSQELKFLMARIEKALQGPRFVVSQKDVQELMQLDNLNDVLKKARAQGASFDW